MAESNEELVPVFIPALITILVAAEDRKGKPLTAEEVLVTRDKSTCIMMKTADAAAMAESRGYRDIDPENCWYDWQHARRSMGRKPDLDPGPKMNLIRSSEPKYLEAIEAARSSLDQFRQLLDANRSPRPNAMVKTKVSQDGQSAFMWLSNVRPRRANFIAEFFEVPANLTSYHVGDALEVAEADVLDWMVNDEGVLYGGYSLRYVRSTLPEDERAAYDEYIGVSVYT